MDIDSKNSALLIKRLYTKHNKKSIGYNSLLQKMAKNPGNADTYIHRSFRKTHLNCKGSKGSERLPLTAFALALTFTIPTLFYALLLPRSRPCKSTLLNKWMTCLFGCNSVLSQLEKLGITATAKNTADFVGSRLQSSVSDHRWWQKRAICVFDKALNNKCKAWK